MDYINGMETARKLRNRKFKGFIIFITILKEMVFQLWQVFPRRQVQQGPDGEADEFTAVVIQIVQAK